MISGGYFLADITTLAISGKNIGGYLDDAVDEPFWEFN
jgi:hypothetical protein